MAIFFTADTHFGHSNIIRHSNRPYENAHEMDEALIANWNKVVKQTDTVYHLGDISVLRPERTREILDRLKGKIYLICGNHERSAKHAKCASRFEWIKDYFVLKLPFDISLVLFHYSLRVWEKKHYGAWHLYGHSHGSLPPVEGSFSLDVGVDCWNYFPVSFHTIQAEMERRGWEPKRKPTYRNILSEVE